MEYDPGMGYHMLHESICARDSMKQASPEVRNLERLVRDSRRATNVLQEIRFQHYIDRWIVKPDGVFAADFSFASDFVSSNRLYVATPIALALTEIEEL
jgi:hypothetical protein